MTRPRGSQLVALVGAIAIVTATLLTAAPRSSAAAPLVCTSQTVPAPQGVPTTISLACTGGPAPTIVTPPMHGGLGSVDPMGVVTYTPPPAYDGPDFFTFHATDAQGPSNVATVTIVVGPPVNIGLPTIAGAPVGGQTLSEGDGSWSNSPTSFAYQWGRCDATGGACSAVAGATAQNYVLGPADVGSTVRVLETAANANGPGPAAVSNATAVVAPSPSPPFNTTRPAITGQPYVGATLSCSTGSWTGTPPITYSFQWLGDGTPFAGATASTYKTTIDNVALAFTCAVTATNPGGRSTRESAALLVTSPPPCFGLAAGALAGCRARATYDAAVTRCRSLSATTSAGRRRRSACVATAKLSYKRARAAAKCKSVKGAHKRADCLLRASAVKK